ncbi:hypothetical protein SAMN05421839_10526 [Halolactibacillus halophilus]|uniref:Uncharacterized protein n=1 Tax=Halolactibacillus halophilus TaxID=306540 RepID=A0A1I5MCJ1_9BACI|nr:hypothetical protein [Halolactibacillus halophilus]GEM02079.1 hypothetical protein HHA03_16110 [Halolactibacillus halophilus]SFP07275.1 hypothetical protein SAMN05421839_10526 [Halolactibacillus halophilus]
MRKTDGMKIVQQLMLGFYLLGLIAFLIVGDLTTTMNKVILGLFILLIVRESMRYYIHYVKPNKAKENVSVPDEEPSSADDE